MKRFILFGGNCHDELGGLRDALATSNSGEVALQHAQKLTSEGTCHWVHILDAHTGETQEILEGATYPKLSKGLSLEDLDGDEPAEGDSVLGAPELAKAVRFLQTLQAVTENPVPLIKALRDGLQAVLEVRSDLADG